MKRKLQLGCAALVFALMLMIGSQMTYASQEPADAWSGNTETTTETTEIPTETPVPEKTVYKVTVRFKANGGQGSMKDLVVESGKTTKLKKNTFKNGKCKFAGWSLTANGKVKYSDRADVSKLAKKSNDGTKITLYAQWKLPTPKLKKATSKTPSYIDVNFNKVSNVSGYRIQYSTDSKFKKSVRTVTAGKKDTTARLTKVIPGKKYYIRMYAYKTRGGREAWRSDWSNKISVKVKNGKTLMNVKAAYGIEADVKLKGSGSGYHAKLVLGTPYSAVSFGMQYDVGAANPYGSRNMALIENVSSNNAGGQSYWRPQNIEFQLDKTYHLMITADKNGNGNVYVNYQWVDSFKQPNLKGNVYMWLEVSGRLNGDSVDAEFANVRCKDKDFGTYMIGDGKDYSSCRHDRTNPGLKCKYNKKTNTIRMYGTIRNLSGDWDSAYNGVSYRLHVK